MGQYDDWKANPNLSQNVTPVRWSHVNENGSPSYGAHKLYGGDTIQNYNGPGGSFSRNVSNQLDVYGNAPQGLGGDWTNSAGVRMSDLGGYLGMKDQQKQGSDFSGYQNQLQGLMNDPSKIQQTAGYQFAVNQGNQAIDRSAAAKGMSNSGNVLAELAKYGQGMASQEYGNQVNRLSGLMQNAQNFGLQSGYYDPAQYTPNMGLKPGLGGVSGGGGALARTNPITNIEPGYGKG